MAAATSTPLRQKMLGVGSHVGGEQMSTGIWVVVMQVSPCLSLISVSRDEVTWFLVQPGGRHRWRVPSPHPCDVFYGGELLLGLQSLSAASQNKQASHPPRARETCSGCETLPPAAASSLRASQNRTEHCPHLEHGGQKGSHALTSVCALRQPEVTSPQTPGCDVTQRTSCPPRHCDSLC